MSHILFILPGFTVGGTVYSTLNMLSLLSTEGYKISVFPMANQGPVKNAYRKFDIKSEDKWLSLISGATNKEKGIKKIASIFVKLFVVVLNMANVDLKRIIYKRAATQLDRTDLYDYVVACQEGVSTQFVSYFKNLKKIAWVRCEYSSYKSMVKSDQFDKECEVIYPSFNRIVCVSETTRNDFVQYFPKLRERVVAIHNIQDVKEIVEQSKEPINVEFLADCFNIVSIGRIAPQKRFFKIPEIADNLSKQGLSFKWYIIGDGNVDGEGDRLKESIIKYHCEDCVICLGHKLNPYPYIRQANLLVNTSYTEACPRVIAEARILHTPTVCANFNSAREFLDDGVNGYIGAIEQLPFLIGKLIRENETYQRIKQSILNLPLDEENKKIMSQLKEIFS